MLDDAARALNEADHRWRALIGDVGNPSKREALGEAGVVLGKTKERIAIRFGRTQDVTTTFEVCADAMLEAFDVVGHFPELTDLRERSCALQAAGEKFEQLRPAFIDAATARAGVDLPARA